MVWALSLSTTDLIARSLTPKVHTASIRSLIGFGNVFAPLAHSVLYLQRLSFKANPKAISGRTSYLRVRLEFLPYPQLIRRLFNDDRFGPPCGFTHTSPWPRIDHPVSGLLTHTRSPSFKTRFPYGSSALSHLSLACVSNSPDRSSISTTSGTLPSPPSACKHRVSGSFSLPSRGSFHLSLTVLLHYRSPVVFSLGGWSPLLHTSYHGTGATQDQNHYLLQHSAYGALTLFGRPSHAVRLAPFGSFSILSYNPCTYLYVQVWALPLSLAATRRISFDFFSSGY